MHPHLRALAAEQGGVFTRRQVVGVGCTPRELRTRTAPRGDWVVVRRGVYAERAVWDGATDDGRYRMRVHAAFLCARGPALASHVSSAALLGFPLRPRWRSVVHLTRPGAGGSRVEGGVKHHPAAAPAQVLHVGATRLTGPARTALDVARELGFEDGVVAADAALRRGATPAAMQSELAAMAGWPRVTTAAAVTAVADAGAESVGETLLRLLVLELGIGTPQTQFRVTDGRRTAVADLRVGRHLFEFDGRVKYLGRERGGVAEQPAHEVLWREKQREDWLRRQDGGYGISRVVWPELQGRARAETRQRLLQEYRETERRLGPAS